MRHTPQGLLPLLVLCMTCGCEADSERPPPPNRDLATDSDVVLDTVVHPDGPADVVDVVDVDEPEEVVLPECGRTVEEFHPLASRAGYDDVYAEVWKVQGTFTGSFDTAPRDTVDIESWRGDSVEDGPWTSGVYTIDAWVSPFSCGLCVYYFEGCTDLYDEHSCEKVYHAVEAILDLESLVVDVGGAVTGLLSDVYMVEVDWATGNQLADGTSFCLEYWAFSETFGAISDWAP